MSNSKRKQQRTFRLTVLASVALAALQVHAQDQAPADPPPAEGASASQLERVEVRGSFLGAGATSVMKNNIAARDTPFSAQTYTTAFMKAIETASLADLYVYMNGVQKGGNTGYDLRIRGFRTGGEDKNAIMVDGLPGLTGRFGSPPTIGVQSVEVVKGPMSLLYGQVQPGGFVNIVSKKPMSSRKSYIDLKVSSFDGAGISIGDKNAYNFGLDTTGPIDKDGTFLYRLVAEGTNKDGFRTDTHERASYFAPSVTWNATDDLSLTAQYEHRTVNSSYDVGLAVPGRDITRINPDIRTRYQEPGDWRKETGDTLSLSMVDELNDNWKVRGALRVVRNVSDDSTYNSTSIRADGVSLVRRARQNEITRTYKFGDINLTGKLKTGDIKHQLILGLNGGRDTDDENRLRFFNGGACPGPTCFDIKIYNPVYGQVPDINTLPLVNPATPGNLTDQYFVSTSWGLYLSDLISVSEHWKVNLGVRNAYEKQDISERRQNVPAYSKTTRKSALPTAGLIYQPDKQWSIYASYATSYVPAPANSIDATGANPFKPSEGKLNEVGVKAEDLFDHKVNGTFSLFRITKTNTLNTFACPLGTCSSQLGEEQSKGAEVELNIRPLPDWQLVLNYAYTDAKVTASSDPIQVGAQLTNVSKNTASLWSRYDIGSGALRGLGIGLGLSYAGARNGTLPTTAVTASTGPTPVKLPGYSVMDLAFYYIHERYAFNLKIGNVLDKTYYESAGQTGQVQVQPGAPRNITASMRVNF
ncbi:TonB-dependent siderophore receptor [Pelomonas sp. KK5]|uniref:TonB-dependent siderophore receptor n=1 Tax=Pelomonas sp. KK5 TaxID=1855730 RepID=UPI00097CAC80|nr:TonB-dependent siderophore receptor [Pelomonas sp. KK5]